MQRFKTWDHLYSIMYDSPQSVGFQTIYVRLRDLGSECCPFCDSRVIELYPDSGHSFVSLMGWMNLITYWYECTNKDCPSGGKFKVSQPYVLPYKKFGQDIWNFAIYEWEEYKSQPEEIVRRLKREGVYISEDTIREILEQYTLLKDKQIDKKTLESVQKQGRIIVGCDGTPTETGHPSLWSFYDGISGRLLYSEYLRHADAPTLCRIFKYIRERYGVPIVAFLSDHQPSVVNACRDYDPAIPHQTCHYHYLRNHWVFLEEKDTHMNLQLRKIVNDLAIGKSEPNDGTYYSNGIKIEKRVFFEPLIMHLKKAVNFKNDEFKSLKGMKAVEELRTIVDKINHELKTLDPRLRPTKQLVSLKDQLVEGLNLVASEYADLVELMAQFQKIRAILGNSESEKEKKIEDLEKTYDGLFKSFCALTKYKKREEITSKQAKYDMSNALILIQWCRLWDSHKPNLFFYYQVPDLEKTNIYNEQIFSLLKTQAVKAHGLAHKKYMVITRGDIYLSDICDKKSVSIHEVLTNYNLKEVTKLKQPLQQKIDAERKYFRGSKVLDNSVKDIARKIRNKSWEQE